MHVRQSLVRLIPAFNSETESRYVTEDGLDVISLSRDPANTEF